MDDYGGSILDGLFGLVGKKIDQQTAAKQAAASSKETWSDTDPRLAVDEYGRPYLRGAPSSTLSLSTVPPAVWIGAAVVVAALVVFALKR